MLKTPNGFPNSQLIENNNFTSKKWPGQKTKIHGAFLMLKFHEDKNAAKRNFWWSFRNFFLEPVSWVAKRWHRGRISPVGTEIIFLYFKRLNVVIDEAKSSHFLWLLRLSAVQAINQAYTFLSEYLAENWKCVIFRARPSCLARYIVVAYYYIFIPFK